MSSYRQIFKSTALIGGSQVVTMGINIMRTKVLASLLGPAGIGLAGLYMSATGLIGTLAGMGIGSSGVRQIAEAAGSGDNLRVARTIITLRRVSLVSGILGMLIVILLARPLSRSTFGDEKHIVGMSLMSLTLLFAGISSGQSALLQGLRRLRHLAASQVVGAAIGALISVAFVVWLKERGIVPFLVAGSAMGILLTWWYARKVSIPSVHVTYRESLNDARSLVSLGAAFAVSGLLSMGVAYLTRVMVQRNLGMQAVGLYQACWTLSSYYVGIILGAMGTDFLPRLTERAHDRTLVNRLVNEQAEMGILIATPGVLATLALAPWVLKLFYSGAFSAAADLVRWQIIGVFLRVVCFPLGFILIAQARMKLFIVTEVLAWSGNLAMVYLGMKQWGLEGVGVGFFGLYVLYTILMVAVCRRLTGFRWSSRSIKVLIPSCAALTAGFLTAKFIPSPWREGLGLLLTAMAGLGSLHGLKKLLGISLWELIQKKFQLKKTAV